MNPLDNHTHNKNVYLYTGRGTGEVSKAQAEKSFRHYLGNRSARLIPLNDPSYLQNPQRITDPEAIVFPGGSAVAMSGYLGDMGLQGVKSIVEDKKASYIGFCAGGYLAATTQYTTKMKEKVQVITKLNFKLNLSSYLHCGPAYAMEETPSLKTAITVPIQQINASAPYYSEPFYVYWNGGGYYNFVNPWQDARLASYATLDLVEGQKTAVVAERYKGTPVVISYVHPEIRLTAEEIERYCPQLNDKDEYLASAPQQEALFSAICQEAYIAGG